MSKKEICVWANGKVIPVTFENIDDPTTKETKNYIDYVAARINTPIDSLVVKKCDDGKVDIHYNENSEKFEHIKRITGK